MVTEGSRDNQAGFWRECLLAETADRFYPIILLSHFEVLGEKNKQAQYAKSNNEGYLVTFIATIGLLD